MTRRGMTAVEKKMTAEYWCDQGLEITVDGPDGRFSVKVEKPFARIGRHESSEVVLPDKRIPRRSLYLHAMEAGIFYVRLASSPPDGNSGSQGWLAPDQIITVGQYKIVAQLSRSQPKPTAALPDIEGRDFFPPHPVLMLVDRGRTVARLLLRRRLSIVGREERNTLPLADAQISTSHCALFREADKLWVIDLLSSNGTFIAGQRLESALVAPGQSLTLGNSVSLIYLSTPQADDDFEELTLRLTGRMIQLDRRSRWRRRLLMAAVVLLVLLAAAGGVLCFSKDHLANLWDSITSFWSDSR
jgi:pSer/pThr/pTyr-binding forkhead associated (FHA) protein